MCIIQIQHFYIGVKIIQQIKYNNTFAETISYIY